MQSWSERGGKSERAFVCRGISDVARRSTCAAIALNWACRPAARKSYKTQACRGERQRRNEKQIVLCTRTSDSPTSGAGPFSPCSSWSKLYFLPFFNVEARMMFLIIKPVFQSFFGVKLLWRTLYRCLKCLLHTRIWVTDVTPIMESPLKLESPALLYKLWICFLRLRAVYVGFNTRFLEPWFKRFIHQFTLSATPSVKPHGRFMRSFPFFGKTFSRL